jgi:hypothetical protein
LIVVIETISLFISWLIINWRIFTFTIGVKRNSGIFVIISPSIRRWFVWSKGLSWFIILEIAVVVWRWFFLIVISVGVLIIIVEISFWFVEIVAPFSNSWFVGLISLSLFIIVVEVISLSGRWFIVYWRVGFIIIRVKRSFWILVVISPSISHWRVFLELFSWLIIIEVRVIEWRWFFILVETVGGLIVVVKRDSWFFIVVGVVDWRRFIVVVGCS